MRNHEPFPPFSLCLRASLSLSLSLLFSPPPPFTPRLRSLFSHPLACTCTRVYVRVRWRFPSFPFLFTRFSPPKQIVKTPSAVVIVPSFPKNQWAIRRAHALLSVVRAGIIIHSATAKFHCRGIKSNSKITSRDALRQYSSFSILRSSSLYFLLLSQRTRLLLPAEALCKATGHGLVRFSSPFLFSPFLSSFFEFNDIFEVGSVSNGNAPYIVTSHLRDSSSPCPPREIEFENPAAPLVFRISLRESVLPFRYLLPFTFSTKS